MRKLPHFRASIARSVALLLTAFVPVPDASASTLFASVGDDLFAGQGNAGSVLIVELDGADQVSGVQVVGSGPAPTGLGGLAFDATGTLFGTTESLGGFAPSELYTLDSVTGEVIANLGTVNDGTADLEIADIDFDPLTGALFGISSFETSACDVCLYEIDLATAAASQVGASLPGVTAIEAMAFTPDGTLFVVALTNPQTQQIELLTLDPADASIKSRELIVIDPPFMGADRLSFSGMGARPEDGVLFAVQRGGSPDLFMRVEGASPAWRHIGSVELNGDAHVSDLAFQSVPEPGRLALLVLAGAVALVRCAPRRSRHLPSRG